MGTEEPDLSREIRLAYREGGIDAVIALLRPIADTGDAEAQYWLGCVHFLGEVSPIAGAREWFARAAEQGHLEALYRLGTLTGGREGDELVLRAASGGSLNASVAVAVGYALGEWSLGKRLEEARRWYRVGAEGGLRTSAYELGLMLMYGEGGERNLAEGIGWLAIASSLGFADAARVLSLAFERGGDGLPRSEAARQIWKAEEERLRNLPVDDPIEEFMPGAGRPSRAQ